jgi:hypothetical protein
MDRNHAQEKLIEYLYGELPPPEKAAFEEHLKTDPEMSEELRSFQTIRQVFQNHLDEEPVSGKLRARLLSRLEIRRSWWRGLLNQGFFRPAFVGAFTLLLTLGIAYQFRDRVPGSPSTAQVTPTVSPPAVLSQKDFLTAALASQPTWSRPMWRSEPKLMGGLVSLASYGSPTMPQSYGEATGYDIRQMDQDADWAVAQFLHQRALRLRAMGDFQGSAQEFANLIKKYPSYPHVFSAAAQRIDCLLRNKQNAIARRELIWLNQQSPFLAKAVAQRWGI